MTTIAVAAGRPEGVLRVAARLTGVQLRVLVREPMATIGTIGFPAMTVLVLAGVFGKVPDPDFGGVPPSDHYFAGYIGVVLAAMGLITIPVHLATQRELGVLRRFRASGLNGPTVLACEVAIGAILGTLSVAVVLVLGKLLYGLAAPENLVGVVLWFLAGMACFVAIGCALGTLARSGRGATALGNVVFIPMFLLGGGGPPRAVMTPFMRTLSDVLPLSHVVGGLRQSWLGTTDDPTALWWPVLLAIVAVAAAVSISKRRAV